MERNRGFISIGTLLGVLLFGAAIWLLFHILPFFYYSEEMRGFMESQAEKAQISNDNEIRRFLVRKIRDLELPVDSEDDLKINRFNGNLVIELEYSEVLFIELFGKTYDLWVFHFHPKVERPA